MATLLPTNYQGSIEAVIFPKVLEKLEGRIQNDGIYGLSGRFSYREQRDSYQFVVENVCSPAELPSEAIRKVGISLDSSILASSSADQYLGEVISFLVDHHGNLPLSVFLDDDKSQYVKSSFSIEYTKGLRKELSAFPLVRNVYLS